MTKNTKTTSPTVDTLIMVKPHALTMAGQAADSVAAHNALTDYRDRKAKNTVRRVHGGYTFFNDIWQVN